MKQRLIEMCKQLGLQPDTLMKYFIWKCRGYNNLEAAEKMDMSRQTVHRYSKMLKDLTEEDYKELRNLIFNEITMKENGNE